MNRETTNKQTKKHCTIIAFAVNSPRIENNVFVGVVVVVFVVLQ